MLRVALTICLLLQGSLVKACETALLLSIDVSNSVDPGEYRLQTDGLADALSDPEIIETLVRGEVALSVIQWSGVDRQEISIPWTRMRTALDVQAFAQRARLMLRAYILSDTAPAEALAFSLNQFAQVPDCERKVIDVSGDGTANAGSEVGPVRRRAERMGVIINGIAIESMGLAITNYYRRNLITRTGFVLTARGHLDYPRAIRLKILREITKVLG
jgi:Ca-activated chloride channel family protein